MSVDLEARVERFREGIEGEGGTAPWILEEEGRVVGQAGVHAGGADGVLSLGMGIRSRRAGGASTSVRRDDTSRV